MLPLGLETELVCGLVGGVKLFGEGLPDSAENFGPERLFLLERLSGAEDVRRPEDAAVGAEDFNAEEAVELLARRPEAFRAGAGAAQLLTSDEDDRSRERLIEVTPERECLRGLPTGFIIPDKDFRIGSVVLEGVRWPTVPGPTELRLEIGSTALRLVIGSTALRLVIGSLRPSPEIPRLLMIGAAEIIGGPNFPLPFPVLPLLSWALPSRREAANEEDDLKYGFGDGGA